MSNIVYKRFSFLVDTANQSYNKKFDLDKNNVLVRALQVSSDHPELIYYRGTQRVEINGDEIFPEDYDSRLLLSGISVAADDRFVPLGNGAIAGNGEIKVLYKDADNTSAVFQAYQFILICKCELKNS
jgi:hypothetical protein